MTIVILCNIVVLPTVGFGGVPFGRYAVGYVPLPHPQLKIQTRLIEGHQ